MSLFIPNGIVIMWSGAIIDIPEGWALCDGTNGTPDLRNRFIIGAGDTYSNGNTGGSANAIVPSHTHTISATTAESHTHRITISQAGGTQVDSSGNQVQSAGQIPANNVGYSTSGSHSHSFNTNTVGTSGTNKNLPPYYALAYIVKGAE